MLYSKGTLVMGIKICKARENNLKNLSVDIPIGKVTAITGVSGSGKSTLLKNILGAAGARRYTCIKPKTVRDALTISNAVKAESIENLPITILIDAKSSISNAGSTVSTVSGTHEILRNLFEEAGECNCPYCHSKIKQQTGISGKFVADITCDDRYEQALEAIKGKGKIERECFFDKNMKPLSNRSRTATFAEIHFELTTVPDSWVREFNKRFQCTILTEAAERHNPLTLIRCEKCGKIVPRLIRSRLSFNTPFEDGGGMCRSCHGIGVTSGASVAEFIVDDKKTILNGGVRFVSEKGIQFSTINASILKAAAKSYGFDFKTPIKHIPSDCLSKLMFGTGTPLVINVGKGKKKEVNFKGIIGTLQENFLKGKGLSSLSKYFETGLCPSCHGKRIDPAIDGLTLWGKPMSAYLSMTFAELRDWCKASLPKSGKNIRAYIERLLKKMDAFCQVSCGHLSLDRSSNTLSGGELQRIRVCALLNANVNGICYLLDEPSSGLHEQDIESLGQLLKEICNRGNTVIMVEHNKQLLNYCDWIVDIGPGGGDAGGTLMFSDHIKNAGKYTTQTAKLLTEKQTGHEIFAKAGQSWEKFLNLDHLIVNNLKNVNVSLPYKAFTTVCGISGSGKSTFLRDVLYAQIADKPTTFGFENVVYLAQKAFSAHPSSCVATQLECFASLIQVFAKSAQIPTDYFLPNSKAGKCKACAGRGHIISDANEFIGICSECCGHRYSPEVLGATAHGITFKAIMQTPLAMLGNAIPTNDLKSLSRTADLLGIGYLNFSRRTNTLSKGELQRLRIANAISQGVQNSLFLLDEPSRGLHASDSRKLVEAVHNLTKLGNTVVTVEHNPIVIGNSDYIVEFGGTGKDGGYLLYDGIASDIQKADTPTARALLGKIKPNASQGQKHVSNIEFKCGTRIERFKLNDVHHLSESHSNEIIDLAALTTADFLSVAVQGNSFYSRARHYNETAISTPIIHHIDFASGLKYEYSLYDFLGLKDLFVSSAMAHDHAKSELLRYIFDDSSPTGKCPFCAGRGIALTVPENFFFEDGVLTKECRTFIRKNTNLMAVINALKLNTGVDVLSNNSRMDTTIQNIFLYGSLSLRSNDCQPLPWPGIIKCFLRNHAYYPSKHAEKVFSQKTIRTCPVCSGKMLSAPFLKLANASNLTYQDVQSRPFLWISQHLHTGNDCYLIRFKAIIEDAIKLGLGTHCAREQIQDLPKLDSALSALIALKHFGFSQSGIALSNTNLIPASIQKATNMLIKDLQHNNTIFIC